MVGFLNSSFNSFERSLGEPERYPSDCPVNFPSVRTKPFAYKKAFARLKRCFAVTVAGEDGVKIPIISPLINGSIIICSPRHLISNVIVQECACLRDLGAIILVSSF